MRCVCERGTGGACGGQQLPGAIGQRFDQACRLIGRAGTTNNQKKARALVKKAKRVLSTGARAVANAKKNGRIGESCAAQLDGLFGDARGRAERWLTTR